MYRECLPDCQKALDFGRKHHVDIHYVKGLALMNMGKCESALEELSLSVNMLYKNRLFPLSEVEQTVIRCNNKMV